MIRKNNNKSTNPLLYLAIMLGLLMIATLIGYLFRHIAFPETTIVLTYLLAVLITARYTNGYLFGVIASIISIFAYNFFFTAPYFTFIVNDPSYLVTFTIMMIAALVVSTLTSSVRKNALEAKEKEAETKALYMLTNHLTDANDLHDIAKIAIESLSKILDCDVACLCFNENEQPEASYLQQVQTEQRTRSTENQELIRQEIENHQNSFYMDEEFSNWIIYGHDNVLGIIRIPKLKAQELTDAQTHLLKGMIDSVALAMDRFISAQQRLLYREETVQERYRSNLLRAISHDLRTPLSCIMGTAEMLMDMSKSVDPRFELAKQIHDDADWLHSLVENILSLTRLQDGKMIISKQPEAVEEVIGAAIHLIAQRAPDHEITVKIPSELLLVPMDARLIQQVIINLLDNAVKHTTFDQEIMIEVTQENQQAVFKISDRGEGISKHDLPNIFQMFYTSKTATRMADSKHGIGLGLTICDVIIKAHGGTIQADNRHDGPGAEFIFTLPMED